MGAEQSTPTGELDDGGLPSALVVVGPSGVGKGTLISRLMSSSDSFGFSCSHTTRAARESEKVTWTERISSDAAVRRSWSSRREYVCLEVQPRLRLPGRLLCHAVRTAWCGACAHPPGKTNQCPAGAGDARGKSNISTQRLTYTFRCQVEECGD